MRAAHATVRSVVETPGFTLFLTLDGDAPYLSTAVPRGTPSTTADAWAAALAELPAAFAAYGRSARIEMFAELQPELLRAAEAAGWQMSQVAPVMTLTPEAFAAASEPTKVGEVAPLDAADRPRLEAALRAQHVAFGGDGGDGALDWLPSLERGLRDGSVLGGTIEVAGAPVSGATMLFGGDAGELAGVWTDAAHRGHGYASQVCHALLRASFDRGLPIAWLSAAEGALRIYQRLGFVRVGTQVNLDAPATSTR